MVEINDLNEYLAQFISKLIDKTNLKTKIDSIDQRLLRVEEQLKTMAQVKTHPRDEHRRDTYRHRDKSKHFESKPAEKPNFMYDLHGNKVPLKETMNVKKYTYDGAKQGRCKVWGCDERAFDKGYCSKHRDKYYPKETGIQETTIPLEAHEEKKPEPSSSGKGVRKKNHRRKDAN